MKKDVELMEAENNSTVMMEMLGYFKDWDDGDNRRQDGCKRN